MYIHVGDVIEYAGKEFLVEKINPKNYKVKALHTNIGYNLPKHLATYVRIATAEDYLKMPKNEVPSEPMVHKAPQFRQGMLVRFIKPSKVSTVKELWVVGGINAKTVTLYKFGGSLEGKYLRVSPTYLTEIDVQQFLKGEAN